MSFIMGITVTNHLILDYDNRRHCFVEDDVHRLQYKWFLGDACILMCAIIYKNVIRQNNSWHVVFDDYFENRKDVNRILKDAHCSYGAKWVQGWRNETTLRANPKDKVKLAPIPITFINHKGIRKGGFIEEYLKQLKEIQNLSESMKEWVVKKL